VALAIVMWFVAGMSLLVAGIVLSARTDVRLAQVHYARAQVAAAGDGAINLLLADLVDARSRGERGPGGRLPQQRYRVGDDMVSVLAIPQSAFVDVAGASAEELAKVIEASGAVAPGGGSVVARAVVQYRDGADGQPYGRLESFEDLLGVAGVDRSMLDALTDYVAVGGSSGRGGGADGAGTLEQTLRLLRSVAPATRARNNDLDATPVRVAATRPRSSASFRVDALVQRGQDVWLRRRWVSLGRGAAGLPWSSSRIEPVRIVPRPI